MGFSQAILTLGDKDLDGRMDMNEFMQFVTEQERKLWEVFSTLDTNGNGMLLLHDNSTILLEQSVCNLVIVAQFCLAKNGLSVPIYLKYLILLCLHKAIFTIIFVKLSEIQLKLE